MEEELVTTRRCFELNRGRKAVIGTPGQGSFQLKEGARATKLRISLPCLLFSYSFLEAQILVGPGVSG